MTANEGAGTKTGAEIVIGSVSKATEVDIMESGTGRGSSGSRMGTEIGIGNSTARERGSGTHREGTIGTETMVAPVAVVVVGRAWRGSSMRNTGGTMISAMSSGTMMNVVTIEGVKRVRLLAGVGVGAVEHGKTLAVALRQRGGRRLLKGVFPCHSADARPLDGTSMH